MFGYNFRRRNADRFFCSQFLFECNKIMFEKSKKLLLKYCKQSKNNREYSKSDRRHQIDVNPISMLTVCKRSQQILCRDSENVTDADALRLVFRSLFTLRLLPVFFSIDFCRKENEGNLYWVNFDQFAYR
jgi:hypothetical protein